MAARPRKVTDEEVFAAAYRVMTRQGPTEVTLAEMAREAGVTAGALVQRFGSKRDLLLALVAGVAAESGAMFQALRSAHPSPLATVRAYADCMAGMGESPAALAHSLSWLQLDLTDPDFHRHAKAQAQATRAELRALLDEAVAARELPSATDTAALARAVEVTVSGSLMTWAIYQEGRAVDWVRADVESLLARAGAAGS
jgi:AcrR family transcriptional regulator